MIPSRRRGKLILAGGLLLLLLVIAFVSGRGWFTDGGGSEDRPPAVILKKDVGKKFHEPEMTVLERVVYHEVQPEAVGVDSGAAQDEVDAFVAAVADTTNAAPTYAPFDFRIEDDNRLMLGLYRSDGVREERHYHCRPTCVGGARDSTVFVHQQRAGFALWPDIMKKVAICGSIAGGVWGGGELYEYFRKKDLPVSPGLLGAGSGAACAVTVTL